MNDLDQKIIEKFNELIEYIFKYEYEFNKEILKDNPYYEILTKIRKKIDDLWLNQFHKEYESRIKIVKSKTGHAEAEKLQSEIIDLISEKVKEYNAKVYKENISNCWWNYPDIHLLFYVPSIEYYEQKFRERYKINED